MTTREVIARHLADYRAAVATLAADHTTVAERKVAIAVRDTFERSAPEYVAALIALARMRPIRYCPMCETWLNPRETTCKACGMPTEKAAS